MSKRVNFSEYEKQIILTYVKGYANIIEDKRTDKRTSKENGMAWEALTLKFNAEAGVTKRTKKQLEACWKNLKTKHKAQDATDRKERFRTGGGPAPPDSLQDPVSQAVGDILQKRFDPLPNPYDDDADEMNPHDAGEEKRNDECHENFSSRKFEAASTIPVKPSTSNAVLYEKTQATQEGPCVIQSEKQTAVPKGPSEVMSKSGGSDIKKSVNRKKPVPYRKVSRGDAEVSGQILKYRSIEHVEKMKSIHLERKFLILEHKKKMELLQLKINNEKARSSASKMPMSTDSFTLSPTSGKIYARLDN